MSDLAEQNGIGLTHRGQTIKPTYDSDMSPMFYGETFPGEAGRITRVGPASFDANQGQVLNTVTHESIHARSIMDGHPNIEKALATAHGNLAQFRWGFRLGRGG